MNYQNFDLWHDKHSDLWHGENEALSVWFFARTKEKLKEKIAYWQSLRGSYQAQGD